MTTKSHKSDVSGDDTDFLVVTDLPTGFRAIPDVEEVHVRGLFFEETLALGRYVGNLQPNQVSYRQIVKLYKDAIRGVDLLALEPVDLQVLMIISSIWTVDDFGWTPDVDCPQTLPNEERVKLANSLETDAFESEAILQQMQEKLALMPEKIPCTGTIDDKILLDDFDFEDPKVRHLPIPIKIKGEDYQIGALTVGDKVRKEEFLELNPTVDPTVVDYASLIKNEGMTLEDKIKVVRFGDTKSVMAIKDLDSEMLINIKPLKKKCNSCHKASKVYIGLDELKAYP